MQCDVNLRKQKTCQRDQLVHRRSWFRFEIKISWLAVSNAVDRNRNSRFL